MNYGSQQLSLYQRQREGEVTKQKEMLYENNVKKIEEERALLNRLQIEEMVEKKRFQKLLQEAELERETEEAIIKSEKKRCLKLKQLEQEERLAKELDRLKYEKLRDEKMRQHIKENSVELRELETKLNAAYMNRERAAQIAEKEAIRYEQIKRDAEISKVMKKESERVMQEEIKIEQKRHNNTLKYQKELELQLNEKEKKKQEAYDEFLKEKLMIDEIVRKIYDEDFRERELKLEKMRATQRYIEEFKEKQAEWQQMEHERMEEENRKILEFANAQKSREDDRMAKAREREQQKEVMYKKLSENMEKGRHEREEMEKIRQELYLEEQEELARQEEMEEIESRIRRRLEMQRVYKEQMIFKQKLKEEHKKEEEELRNIMMAKFAEDDRIEQMNAQKRRMKQLEHKRAVEKLIEDRRKQIQASQEREIEQQQEEERREANRQHIIEQERQKLLKEHASKLLGYLPKGIFRDEDDLNLFDENFKENFKKRSVDLPSC